MTVPALTVSQCSFQIMPNHPCAGHCRGQALEMPGASLKAAWIWLKSKVKQLKRSLVALYYAAHDPHTGSLLLNMVNHSSMLHFGSQNQSSLHQVPDNSMTHRVQLTR